VPTRVIDASVRRSIIPVLGEQEAMMKRILIGATLVILAGSAWAQDRRPDYGPAVDAVAAKKIAAAAIAECQKNSWNVAVAVVDTHGFLVYFERMDNTQTASMDIAIGKARSAATYRRPTRAFVDVINKGGPATATLPGVFASPGGLPIMVDGKVTGGVGVSGVTGDQDEQCAKAGLGGT
jgi:glc operon protein GlcG